VGGFLLFVTELNYPLDAPTVWAITALTGYPHAPMWKGSPLRLLLANGTA